MDVVTDLCLAIPLVFTVLALVLASVFMNLWGAEGEWPRELPAAKLALESGPGDQEARSEWLPVEEVGAVKEGKETAAKQPEKVAEKPCPAAKPSPMAAAESIPQQLPAEPCKPEPQEDAGDHTALPSKAEEEDMASDKEKLVVREPSSTAATPAPVTSTAASFESSEGFEWPLGTLETCLLIAMGISMLARIQSVFYSQSFCLVPRVKQSRVWVLSRVRQ
ncbi:matrix-remodeling-associated protein 7 [Amazona aestiva]|uniref:Matrix-remodeling-associated protein 7 n=1 Tax=Amazona aestiva TaxID=12930 RepID=A0A0Q3PBW6_AMAAE|nr:matrix-remodeling-associated protein 7 [Amazona aestiva]